MDNAQLQDQIDELKREMAKKDEEINNLKNAMKKMKIHETRPLKMKLNKDMKKDIKRYDRKLRKEIVDQTIAYIQDKINKVRLQKVKEDTNVEEPMLKKASKELIKEKEE
jgi:uncharacterized protein (UPF0305 family)